MALSPAGWRLVLGSKGLAPAGLGGCRMTDPPPYRAQPGEPHAGSATGWQHGLVLGLRNCWRPTEPQAPFPAVSQHLSVPTAFPWLQGMAMLELLQGWSYIRTQDPCPLAP